MESFQVPTYIASLCHESQLVAWQITYTHTRKQCQTTVFYIISTFTPSLRCKFSCRVCYIPPFVFTALCDVTSTYVVACFRGPLQGHAHICVYIHSRAFSVSCCSILWFLKYIDRMQQRGALVALHKGAQECCRHGSRPTFASRRTYLHSYIHDIHTYIHSYKRCFRPGTYSSADNICTA